ncbi:hypothetical protein PMIN01_11825 [Paraphaeosphaeria minitans]|uniref:Uncharacterized protein n=1 Tax=Paraphaeosphaeria minitans TaxID=565426 RepID=A0A9P6KKK2_9PLEO|nr:hypothetical protein PMIN01_11825 [Paraphaeosphaeria minitans]
MVGQSNARTITLLIPTASTLRTAVITLTPSKAPEEPQNPVSKVKKAFEGALVRLVKKVPEDLLAHEVLQVRLVREVCKGTAEALDLEAPMVVMEIQAKLVGTARMGVMAATVGTDAMGMMGVTGEMRYQDGGSEAKINERLTLGRRAHFHRVQQGSDAYSTTVVARVPSYTFSTRREEWELDGFRVVIDRTLFGSWLWGKAIYPQRLFCINKVESRDWNSNGGVYEKS